MAMPIFKIIDFPGADGQNVETVIAFHDFSAAVRSSFRGVLETRTGWLLLIEGWHLSNQFVQLNSTPHQPIIEAMDDFDAEKRLGIVAYGRKTKDTTRKEKKAREEHEERRRARKEQTKRDHGAANREKKADVLAAIRRRVEELIACGTSAAELATACGKTKR